MILRKNTKAFKTILAIVTSCQERADRKKLVRLYITKAGHAIQDRIGVEGISGQAEVFYDMIFQTVLVNLNSSIHQLHQSDDVPGLYFFRSKSGHAWDETPFEFDKQIQTVFAQLSDLPLTRKKEKVQPYVFASPRKTAEPAAKGAKKVPTRKSRKTTVRKPVKPRYQLKHAIEFTELDNVIFHTSQATKKDILDYYYSMADYILPHLKNRALRVRMHTPPSAALNDLTQETLVQNVTEEIPSWIKAAGAKRTAHQTALRCQSTDQLLYYTEKGCLQFNSYAGNDASSPSPDFCVIALLPPKADFEKVLTVALSMNEILTGLKLPSYVKTDGGNGLHIYIPVHSRTTFETASRLSVYICKLTQLKIPDLVLVDAAGSKRYERVLLDYTLNDPEKDIIAPYALMPEELGMVSVPLWWQEVSEGVKPEDLTYATMPKRVKQLGDPFADFYKKKVDADAVLQSMEVHYSFLF